MKEVKYISEEDLFNELKIKKIKLNKKLFDKNDVSYYQRLDLTLSKTNRIITIISYFKFALSHPRFLITFIFPQIHKVIKGLFGKKNYDWQNTNFIVTNNLKASIALGFKPKSVLEIGTYLGAGAASFKYVLPKATVITLNPKQNKDVNNPIHENYIGHFYIKKNLKVKQIYADSTKFDFSKIKKVDFTFIDGNHNYNFVYSDLKNSSKITRKAILIDDYIPENKATKNLPYGPWVEGVVKALNDYLIKNPKDFSKTYWIKNTKYALLIK